ncbi:MAG: hypothetical protein FWF44_11655 [Defluviitaleaceae bacterium]|nr:hypothetical protein [Defluviitaleaceae bacterium]
MKENVLVAPAAYAVTSPGGAGDFLDIIDELMEEYPEFAAMVDSLPAMVPAALPITLPATFPATGSGLMKPAITKEQLRALSRKHLLVMILELERAFRQATEERDHLLLACQTGLPRGWRAYQGGVS